MFYLGLQTYRLFLGKNFFFIIYFYFIFFFYSSFLGNKVCKSVICRVSNGLYVKNNKGLSDIEVFDILYVKKKQCQQRNILFSISYVKSRKVE